tara:strand:- start:275 stop:940 length:666 start_codon:yes stop_codon:yes gene_type:complete
VHNIDINNVEKILSYQFKNKSLLKIALSHSSIKPNPYSYERFEFLGDSIIGFVVSDYLINNTNFDEGGSTIIKSKYVSRNNLAAISKNLNLIKFVEIDNSINLNSVATSTRISSDIYESIVGAIYLDSDIDTVKKFIYDTLLSQKYTPLLDNYKGRLNEYCHDKGYDEPIYRVIKETGLDHMKRFTVEVKINGKMYKASGNKIKSAEIKSAKIALIDLLSL